MVHLLTSRAVTNPVNKATSVFAEPFALSADLAGAAGAAAAIAGGYRLPLTAMAMVLGVGAPQGAQFTSLATVVVALFTGLVTARLVNRCTTALRKKAAR
ncbi:MAG: hypothetical protein ACKOOC_10115 [Cyanobium sp.]